MVDEARAVAHHRCINNKVRIGESKHVARDAFAIVVRLADVCDLFPNNFTDVLDDHVVLLDWRACL